jgi:hypothetical protein
MKRREKILASGLGLVLALAAGDALYEAAWAHPRSTRQNRSEKLHADIAKRLNELRALRRSAKQLDAWRRRSLPHDVAVARSLYQAWLLELVSQAGLDAPHVDSANPVSQRGHFHSLGFSVRGQGSLEQLVAFLYTLYRGGHLHQVRGLNITPVAQQGTLDFSLSIEALSLPAANPTDALAAAPGDVLAFAQLADYRPIVERNLFAAGGGAADAASQAFLTAVLETNGRRQAWFTLRGADQVLKLSIGDPISVGAFHGAVAQIDEQDVILQADQERWLITIGESVSQASALPPEF